MEVILTPGNGGAEKCFSLLDFPNRPAHVVGGGLFEQKSHGAGLGRVFDISVITVRGEHEHLGGGERLQHLAGGFQTIEQRHGDVHQHHVGTKFFGQRNRLAAVLRFAGHFEIVFQFEHLAKSFAHDRMVFRQQNSDSFHNNSRFDFSRLRHFQCRPIPGKVVGRRENHFPVCPP